MATREKETLKHELVSISTSCTLLFSSFVMANILTYEPGKWSLKSLPFCNHSNMDRITIRETIRKSAGIYSLDQS